MAFELRAMNRLGISMAKRQGAERPHQVWSWDFVVVKKGQDLTGCCPNEAELAR